MSFFKSQKKQNLLLLDLFLILILLLFLSEIIMGEDAAISLKKIKKDFIKLDTNLISHEVYIKIDSIVSDYISIQFYIIGSYYLDFSRQEYIFLNSSSINFTFPDLREDSIFSFDPLIRLSISIISFTPSFKS